MNARAYMIIDHRQHKIITRDVTFCQYNETYDRYDVRFGGGKPFSYNASRLSVLINPTVINHAHYRFVYDGKELYDIEAVYVFHDSRNKYWHICFGNGYERSYFDSDLQVSRSCLLDPDCKNVFEYLKQIATCVSVKADDGTKLLEKQYERAGAYIDDVSAATSYLNPSKYVAPVKKDAVPIFPFGCNASQYTAVKAALDSPTSVIQGPPGTGKTQTILNIIANLLIDGKTVQVVSNNNAATANVLEKLSSPKYEMGFLVAPLGSVKNKMQFLANQTGMYPDISSWQDDSLNQTVLKESIRELSARLQELYQAQERLATLRQELQTVTLEKQYFDQYMIETADKTHVFRMRRKTTSDKVMQLWQQLQRISERQVKPSIWLKIKNAFVFGIVGNRFYQTDDSAPIHYLQARYYQTRIEELEREICSVEKLLAQQNIQQLSDRLTTQSMTLLRCVLFKKYGNKFVRPVFTEEDLWKHYQGVQNEYPIVLSTTFSARSSLCRDALFDYVIMDEASQVDVATGALALTSAKRAVVVGDTKQLPNVVTEDIAKRTDAIFDSFSVGESYRFSKKSFLQSLCELLPLVPQTLLREHYRCHPKIIGFCNQAFYDGQLVIMTEDHGEADVLSVVKTVAGDHARDHMNQRQVDAVTEEILPHIQIPAEEIGVIAPYNNQVLTLQKAVASQGIDVATVHKFQGREKDAIILTTVDNEVNE
ncbi:MAG: ATP-binding protein, partial [Clostridia bacterium]|nr:ATP-binding protein [Clostridia bacterium]